jgi:protein TonB
VRFAVVIGKDGRVQDTQIVTGHPLLINAALDAVRQWIYKPTLLNEEPVEVTTWADVNFTLGTSR